MNLSLSDRRNGSGLAALWLGLLVAAALSLACQGEGPRSVQDDRDLAAEMKAWFEVTDYEAFGSAGLEEALESIYQDDGYTVSLYRDLGTLLTEVEPPPAAYDSTLGWCQEWFELIDHERSGYGSLEEAIADIYSDDGATLDLYRRLARRNAGEK